jgi:hypothetical protein
MSETSQRLSAELVAELNVLVDIYKTTISPLQLDRLEIPLNLRAESTEVESAYLAGRSYCPVFEYLAPPAEAAGALRDLMERCSDIGETPWVSPLKDTLQAYISLVQGAARRLSSEVTSRTVTLYGEPRAETVISAVSELERPLPEPEIGDSVGEGEVRAIVGHALTAAGLTDWKCSASPTMSASMDVSADLHEIRVREGERFTRNGIARLLAHEIGVHVFRSASGERQPMTLFRFGLGNYLGTEEGLACYVEELTGIVDELDYRRIPLRYYAASLAMSEDFATLYGELRRFADHELAFETAARAKRGMRLTDGPGAHLKDTVYFAGLNQVSTHLVKSPEDFSLLWIGKISIDFLALVRDELNAGQLTTPARSYDDIAPMLAALEEFFVS